MYQMYQNRMEIYLIHVISTNPPNKLQVRKVTIKICEGTDLAFDIL